MAEVLRSIGEYLMRKCLVVFVSLENLLESIRST